MMRPAENWEVLIACLRGEPPADADWEAIVEVANRTLLTPGLFDALSRASRLDVLPDEERTYLDFIHGCNLERNTRLRTQLVEAVGRLNSVGVEPTLLKGAVRLFCDPDGRLGSRMTRDLDLNVDEHEAEAAMKCLVDIGYQDLVETRGMGRPQDVGALELRQRPGAGSAAYLRREHDKPPVIVERAGVRVKIPSPTSRALHWIVHDLIKEGDYWRGRIDIRHLYDLAELARTEEGVDWRYLRDIMPNQLGRNVIETQMLTLHRLFGSDIPLDLRSRKVVHFQHWRRMFTARHPLVGVPLRIAGNLAWGSNVLLERGAAEFARRFHRRLISGRAGTKL
jgi:hypothetical protein